MKIVLAPNAFKQSLSAPEAARAMAAGALRAFPGAEVVSVPVADGGDGFASVLADCCGGELVSVEVTGPAWEKTAATFGYLPGSNGAAVEMALASGLALIPREKQNPILTTTFGTGELIRAALDRNVRQIAVGIGGSATTDCGMGVAVALGAKFFDAEGDELKPVGGNMGKVAAVDISGLDPRISQTVIEVACDVDNPLFGPTGAAYVYAPQKGASAAQVEALDTGLRNLAEVIRRDLGVEVADIPGAGAAGGLGAGLVAFLGARLRPGVDVVLEMTGLADALNDADLVFTAEGQIDYQTAYGKAPAGVGKLAKAAGVPCIAIAGGLGEGLEQLHDVGINAVFSLCPAPVSLADAMGNAHSYLLSTTEQATRAFLAGRQKK